MLVLSVQDLIGARVKALLSFFLVVPPFGKGVVQKSVRAVAIGTLQVVVIDDLKVVLVGLPLFPELLDLVEAPGHKPEWRLTFLTIGIESARGFLN